MAIMVLFFTLPCPCPLSHNFAVCSPKYSDFKEMSVTIMSQLPKSWINKNSQGRTNGTFTSYVYIDVEKAMAPHFSTLA